MFEDEMLFDVAGDPHEIYNLAASRPDVASKCRALLENWRAEMLKDAPVGDPMQTVMSEGGPFHTRGYSSMYASRLAETGRANAVDEFLKRYPPEENE